MSQIWIDHPARIGQHNGRFNLPDGLIKAVHKGETAIMVRYLGQADVTRVTVPYAEIANFPELPKLNFIDELVIAKWRRVGLLPSELCTDAEFLRRAYLDAIGTLPKPEEIRAFLADTDPDKRKRLIQTLVERPEYVDWWTLKWADILRDNGTATGDRRRNQTSGVACRRTTDPS